MKSNTQNGTKKLGKESARLIRETHGFLQRITKHGGFKNHTFPSNVAAGRKSPSLNFWKGVDGALVEMRADVLREIIRHEHPESRL
jgi:hypothetical protein